MICSRCRKEKSIEEFKSSKICEHCSSYNKEYSKKNKERFKEKNNLRSKEWQKRNRDKTREYEKKQYYSNPNFRLSKVIRAIIKPRINKNSKNKTFEMLGYSVEILRKHLENQFTKEFNWNTYGTLWNMEHIIPLSLYDLSNLEEFKKCWSLRNLRVFSRKDNQMKWKNLDMKLVEEHKIEDLLPRRVKTF
jgi:hypothetical protein